MEESKFYSPLKIGLFIVTLAYFLFTFHAMFTLSWWGEWESLGDSGFWIYLSDITATFGLIFRLIASSVALAAMIYYFVKKNLPQSTATKILRCVLVAEAVYWAPLIVSAVMGFLPILRGFYGTFAIGSLISMGIPCLVGAIALPYALIKLAISLKVKESGDDAIKWGLIAGTIFVLVLWLNNMGMWIYTILVKGTDYLFTYPENFVSFVLTTFGLLALLLAMVKFARKSFGMRTLEELDSRFLGAIIVALGSYFLWNYLSWIIFDTPWSAWYAWFLGHNLDLWLLSIPLVGLPLLFRRKAP